MEGVLMRAAETEQKIQIIYMDKNQKITQRFVTIRSMDEFNIDCYCHLKKQRRIFKRENILSAFEKFKKQAWEPFRALFLLDEKLTCNIGFMYNDPIHSLYNLTCVFIGTLGIQCTCKDASKNTLIPEAKISNSNLCKHRLTIPSPAFCFWSNINLYWFKNSSQSLFLAIISQF